MVAAERAVPEGEAGGEEGDGGGEKRASVRKSGEAVDGAEVAGDVDGDEEEVGGERIKGANRGREKGGVESDFGGEEMGRASGFGEPVSVETGGEIVDEDAKRGR